MGEADNQWVTIEQVAQRAEANGGTIGIALHGPEDVRYSRHGDRQFRAASTVKIPIMIEIYRQIDRGERSLADRYTLRGTDKTPGSGILKHMHDGIELTLDDLIHLMISISDNTATNILIDLAGMDRVNATMRELGMTNSTLGRKMMGKPASGDTPENLATPDDYVTVLQAILDGRAASQTSCEQMTEMLQRQTNARRIARYLPDTDDELNERGIRWGSKTGTIKGVTNDAGFVTTDQGTLILAVYCENLLDHHLAEQAIGDISRAALNATGVWSASRP
jgi:beta-lactamase class A